MENVRESGRISALQDQQLVTSHENAEFCQRGLLELDSIETLPYFEKRVLGGFALPRVASLISHDVRKGPRADWRGREGASLCRFLSLAPEGSRTTMGLLLFGDGLDLPLGPSPAHQTGLQI